MEDKKMFGEAEEVFMAAAKEGLSEGKQDLEEIVAEVEERERQEQEQEKRQADKKEAARKEAEAEERRRNPHGLKRSSVSRELDMDALPQETMEDFSAALEASFEQMQNARVLEANTQLPGKEDVDPAVWDKLKQMMDEKTNILGKITETVKAGVIMYVEGVRGFVPCSKLALEYVEDPTVYVNHLLEVRVINVDEQTNKLVLSAKEILQEKAKEEQNQKISRLTAGSIVEGTVESIRDYGAFVNIGEGISGLLHISQVSERRLKSLKGVLKVGQTVRVMITKVEDGKISLSMKALEDTLKAEEPEESVEEYSDNGSAGTSLGDLFKNFKF